jgi:hypothetical protein
MSPLLTDLSALALAYCVFGVAAARGPLRHTKLGSAWRWAVASLLVWGGAWGLEHSGAEQAPGDLAWYLAALLAICTSVAVLGARRPGIRVWTAFVVGPLLAILGWPVLTLWQGDGNWQSLRLLTPHLLGVTLVLLMGGGNYIGTRFSPSAVIYILSLCLVIGTVSGASPVELQSSAAARDLATVGMALSILLARQLPARGSSRSAPFGQLWSDYRDTFGIVWSKRFQERMNGIAVQQRWPARLTDRGIVWLDARPDEQPQVQERIEQTFRWLLRRFVDPEWIDERLHKPQESALAVQPSVPAHPES